MKLFVNISLEEFIASPLMPGIRISRAYMLNKDGVHEGVVVSTRTEVPDALGFVNRNFPSATVFNLDSLDEYREGKKRETLATALKHMREAAEKEWWRAKEDVLHIYLFQEYDVTQYGFKFEEPLGGFCMMQNICGNMKKAFV